MAVQGVDRSAEAARAQQNQRVEAARQDQERRRAEADAVRQERQAARETNRGGNVDVRG
jgi:hypothetical protein